MQLELSGLSTVLVMSEVQICLNFNRSEASLIIFYVNLELLTAE
jgi:hypothetical protein